MTTYINLYGGPGVGKSTVAAGLFHMLKQRGASVELVTEFVKDLVWEDRAATIAIQPYVSMKQYRNLARLKGKVDYVITDSPLIKDSVYAKRFSPDLPSCYYELLVYLQESLGTSFNVYLEREFKYDEEGRYQKEDEAKQIDKELLAVLHNHEHYSCAPYAATVLNTLLINGLTNNE
jgi:tRNA uridine 5-carbamoylmethylation protein Kti12